MDIFGSDDMQKRGNFISLMFFVMAIGLFIVYGILGWSTNVISQASLFLTATFFAPGSPRIFHIPYDFCLFARS